MKTGSGGRPWVELDRPKPPRVADHYAFWGDPPPERSERCAYWLRQIERGWTPNKYLSREGYDSSSEWFGVYIWEYVNVLSPAIERVRNPHGIRRYRNLDGTWRATIEDPAATIRATTYDALLTAIAEHLGTT